MYARANDLDPQVANEVSNQISKYENALKHADDEYKELVDIYDYVDKEKYGRLIEGCNHYRGITDTLKGHPCATLAYSGDTIEDIGVIMVRSESTKNETYVALVESSRVDSWGFLKQDYLIVDSIGLIYDIYDEVGIKDMTINKMLSLIENDEKTWDIYSSGNTICINQCEQPRTIKKVMKYKPKNISELTQFIAGIRPSFQSMYKIFENREHFDYGIRVFDNLIQDEYCTSSFILYQEHLMKVLGFAGFEMKDTYNIIKAISKKKEYVIKEAREKFIENFSISILETKETNDRPKAVAMSKKVWGIIEDSARYGFNASHAYCMALDSVTLAYLKAHHPLEFYKVCLQRYTDKDNKDKVSLIKKELLNFGIKLNPIKFGDDNRQFSINKDEYMINQTMKSVKNMQKIVPDIMYEIGQKNYQDLFLVFRDMIQSKINKKSFEILIELDYFSEFGSINYIKQQLEVYKKMKEIYEKLSTAKELKKDYLRSIHLYTEEIKGFCGKETEKILKDINNKEIAQMFIENMEEVKKDIELEMPYEEINDIDIISNEIRLIGFSDRIIEDFNDDIFVLIDSETNNYGTPFMKLYKVNDGQTIDVKANKEYYKDNFESGDIIRGAIKEKNKRRKVDGKWIQSEEVELILNTFVKYNGRKME